MTLVVRSGIGPLERTRKIRELKRRENKFWPPLPRSPSSSSRPLPLYLSLPVFETFLSLHGAGDNRFRATVNAPTRLKKFRT